MFHLYFDGSADNARRSSVGASCGYAVYDEDGALLESKGVRLGTYVTSNMAEFRGLIEGLAALKRFGAKKALVRGDSQFVIRAMTGEYHIRNPNVKPLLGEARKAAEGLIVQFEWIRRENNRLADAMCHTAYQSDVKIVDNSPSN